MPHSDICKPARQAGGLGARWYMKQSKEGSNRGEMAQYREEMVGYADCLCHPNKLHASGNAQHLAIFTFIPR